MNLAQTNHVGMSVHVNVHALAERGALGTNGVIAVVDIVA